LVSGKALAGIAIGIVLLVGVVTLAQFHPSSTTETSTSSSITTTPSVRSGFVKGLTFSPATYDQGGTNDFLLKAQQAGQVVEWAGDWEELGGGGSPAAVAQLAALHNLKAMIVVQFFSQSTGQLLRPLNTTNEEHYVSSTSAFASEYKPEYLGIGIEVNILFEKNLTAFNRFVALYSQVYDAVKSASPNTQVFTVFQLEKMNGLGGGLYGGVDDPSRAEWQLLAQFPKDDVLAFTTYPGLIYHTPSDIPSDYYSGIAAHSNRSVGFTEVGWQSGSIGGGWNSSESLQKAFVTRFFALTSGLDRAFAVWSFLYDQNAAAPFSSMGLFYTNGTAKLAWPSWLSGS
jgi:hypothetical protein